MVWEIVFRPIFDSRFETDDSPFFTLDSTRYNLAMSEYRFYHPIEVRYGDLDPQQHVNNARYLTFIEQARIAYVQALGLWDGNSFDDIGIILAEAKVSYRSPILWGQIVQVGVRVTRLGNKSFDWAYIIEDSKTKQLHANCTTIR